MELKWNQKHLLVPGAGCICSDVCPALELSIPVHVWTDHADGGKRVVVTWVFSLPASYRAMYPYPQVVSCCFCLIQSPYWCICWFFCVWKFWCLGWCQSILSLFVLYFFVLSAVPISSWGFFWVICGGRFLLIVRSFQFCNRIHLTTGTFLQAKCVIGCQFENSLLCCCGFDFDMSLSSGVM